MTERYMCPKCKVKVEIDREAGKKTIFIEGIAPPKGHHRTVSFPSHQNCQLCLPIDKMNFKLLERIS